MKQKKTLKKVELITNLKRNMRTINKLALDDRMNEPVYDTTCSSISGILSTMASSIRMEELDRVNIVLTETYLEYNRLLHRVDTDDDNNNYIRHSSLMYCIDTILELYREVV